MEQGSARSVLDVPAAWAVPAFETLCRASLAAVIVHNTALGLPGKVAVVQATFVASLGLSALMVWRAWGDLVGGWDSVGGFLVDAGLLRLHLGGLLIATGLLVTAGGVVLSLMGVADVVFWGVMLALLGALDAVVAGALALLGRAMIVSWAWALGSYGLVCAAAGLCALRLAFPFSIGWVVWLSLAAAVLGFLVGVLIDHLTPRGRLRAL